jgi:hypothetical protein
MQAGMDGQCIDLCFAIHWLLDHIVESAAKHRTATRVVSCAEFLTICSSCLQHVAMIR